MTVRIWDVSTCVALRVFRDVVVLRVAFSPDGKMIGSSFGGVIYLLDPESGSVQKAFDPNDFGAKVDYNQDFTQVATTS